ncbi:FHA domain-containing protein PS1 [Quillaja saponaria]|uniref:FHA domain-containing protein PS1 n=1 Tax=Quillaja saponaria TaxID=32244 RepID=A0AAD7M4H6_QUISA|nr:FHA domain-containing protein PS1 [Quillaja saponaria]
MEIMQNENHCSIESEEIQSTGSLLEGIDSLILEDKLKLTVRKDIPPAPTMPENVISLFCERKDYKSPKDDPLDWENLRLLPGPLGALPVWTPLDPLTSESVPDRVIRELDCMNQRGSLCRRTTKASSVLEWIEECMVQTKWWIHVQSSVKDEKKLTAPTPMGTSTPHPAAV